MANVLDILEHRGFIYQITVGSEEEKARLRDILEERVTCYIGFDPTSTSLHVGSLVPIMSLVHMQRHGHRPIVLVGGGTGLIGDPSGKIEMRKLQTKEEIYQNAKRIKKQLAIFIDFHDQRALLLNNAEWLTKLNYIDMLRDIGLHFSVNRMLTAESIRRGLERGLSFIEFNYMVLQAYDFWHLFTRYDCMIQMGGSDQWGNIVAGIDLIRKLENRQSFGITFPLLETSSGRKMGKTEKGAVWLDPSRTSPYEYFQFWINTEDPDVITFLKLFTFLPMEEIGQVKNLQGADLNPVKAVLAFEATRIAHGEEEALGAYRASAVFGRRKIPKDLLPSSALPRELAGEDLPSIPTTIVPELRLEQGVLAYELFAEVGLCRTRGEARRLIIQGGAYWNEKRIESVDQKIGKNDLDQGGILLRKGKKHYHRIVSEK